MPTQPSEANLIVAPGKVNVPEETQGQIEVGYRYYEGSAAGTVMLGQAPDCRPFRELFDWPEAVISVRADGSDVADVLGGLVGQEDRLHHRTAKRPRGIAPPRLGLPVATHSRDWRAATDAELGAP